ncbi:MAG: hypothetical protein Q7R78_03170 [bacterium]|nr:hypothetical protein [bacterium]
MSKRQILLMLGILIAFAPFAGFRSYIIEIIIIVSGLVVAGIALTLKKEMKTEIRNNGETKNSGPSSSSSSVSSPAPTPFFVENNLNKDNN